MVRLATRADPGLEVCDVEVSRGGTSYTIDTVRHLKSQYPRTEFVLIVGSDAFAEIVTWREYEQLLDEVAMVVMVRGGGFNLQKAISNLPEGLSSELANAPLIDQVDATSMRHGGGKRQVRLTVAKVPQIEISSSEVRRKVNQHRSIQYLVPESVLQYVKERGLYERFP